MLKYDNVDNDVFDPHFDVTTFYDKDEKEQSFLTVLLYLNDDFIGGETKFLDYVPPHGGAPFQEEAYSVRPKAGSILIFHHDLFHSGAMLSSGTKYILRTDVLFQTKLTADQQANISYPKGSSDFDVMNSPRILTMKDLVSKFGFQLDIFNKDNFEKIKKNLDDLSLLEGSVESFCAPGKFLLNQMINDVVRDPNLSTLIGDLVDEAFKTQFRR